MALSIRFQNWFQNRGWQVHPHQQEMVERADAASLLLIAPTGGGKTLAGFLPTLAELADGTHAGLHTIYVSPLKALAADIRRNLLIPIDEIDLPIRVEDRTGDTSATQKKRQRADPPHILLTTPESLALLLSYEDAPRIFAGLQRVIVDEIHSLAESKRGDQLMLCLAELQALCPDLRRVGLSATVEDPEEIAKLLAPQPDNCLILQADPGPEPDIAMLETDALPPWSGGGAAHAIPAVIEQIKLHKTTLIFHNTRAQAEIFFRNLWLANEDGLPIGIHHGSLAKAQRLKIEAAMVAGELRAIVCTGTLDLGIDWGDVDLIIQVGAPKNVKRLVQRIGRANHRYNAPSKALIVPANRFEVVECVAALAAVRAHDLDGDSRGSGPRDVLCQHILIRACRGDFDANELFETFTSAGAYADLSREAFDECLDLVATGGYALRAYDRWQRLKQRPDGTWGLRDPRAAAHIRRNLGTIQDTETLKVRMRGRGKALGEIEEDFAATLTPGDTFLIGGRVVRYEGIREMTVEVTNRPDKAPKIATFNGTKFATSTQLTHRIMETFRTRDWTGLPKHTSDWLDLQAQRSKLPTADTILVESFPHDGRQNTCIYGFAGRNAMQTLGLLISQQMEADGLGPLGFIATDYATLIWGLDGIPDAAAMFQPDALRAAFDDWIAGNAVMKRTFRATATTAMMLERNYGAQRRSGRQATFSSDILYDTLFKYDPDHLLLKITREEAMRGLVDFGRIEELLDRTSGRVDHLKLDRITPLAAPIFLEPNRIPIKGEGRERLLAIEAEKLMNEAGLSP